MRKMVLQMLLETTRLENAQIFRKVRKRPFLDLFPVNCCVNDVTRVCRGRIEAALQPTFMTYSPKTRRRMDFGLEACFQSKTAVSTAKVSFLGKLLL